jgi:outer membrane protein
MKNVFFLGSALLMGTLLMSCNQNSENTTTQQPASNSVASTAVTAPAGEKLKVVALINTDTIFTKYEFAIELKDKLEAKTMKYQRDLQRKGTQLQADLQKLQAEAAQMSQFEGQVRERNLLKQQQELQLKEEEYTRELMILEQEFNRDIDREINTFLEGYCADKPYEMVLSTSELGLVRWAHSSLDITTEVLNGLNEAYAKKNATVK